MLGSLTARLGGIPRGSWSNRHLSLVFMPTEACNFRCTYCYEQFAHGRAASGVVDGLKNLIRRRFPGLSRLSLSWFGGEPLLAVDVVRDVMRFTNRLAVEQPRTLVASDMTTNGYRLSAPLLEELTGLGVREYQITLDGPRAVHDGRRRRAGGQGTFDSIWTHLLAARSVPGRFRIVLRLHVDRDTHGRVPELIDQCAGAFGGDPRFAISPKLVGRWGGPGDARLNPFTLREEHGVLESLRERARRAGLFVFEPDLSLCHAARPNTLVIRADGRINKCTVALEHEANQVGRLLPDGTLTLDPARMRTWTDAAWSPSREERRCPLKRVHREAPPAEIPTEFAAG